MLSQVLSAVVQYQTCPVDLPLHSPGLTLAVSKKSVGRPADPPPLLAAGGCTALGAAATCCCAAVWLLGAAAAACNSQKDTLKVSHVWGTGSELVSNR